MDVPTPVPIEIRREGGAIEGLLTEGDAATLGVEPGHTYQPVVEADGNRLTRVASAPPVSA